MFPLTCFLLLAANPSSKVYHTFFNDFFLLRAANPAIPELRSSKVAGSGTGDTDTVALLGNKMPSVLTGPPPAPVAPN